ncbi:hypothetical protein ACPXB3_22100 [Gordonia sp. DT219]|uniref:hypothetical protein n=1 Tax=Gordonia sp. DT219 TaxID=3416658 RepID=UPI003CE89153
MTGMYSDTEQVVDATIDLIDEIFDVESPNFMLDQIVHRFSTQPERMAQIVMCLGFWASAVPRSGLYEVTNDVAIERARNRLKSDIGGMDAYMELVQEIRTA